jgi:hypothetical protein
MGYTMINGTKTKDKKENGGWYSVEEEEQIW